MKHKDRNILWWILFLLDIVLPGPLGLGLSIILCVWALVELFRTMGGENDDDDDDDDEGDYVSVQ